MVNLIYRGRLAVHEIAGSGYPRPTRRASRALAGAGWKTVNMADGMTGWAVADRPMVSETGVEPYAA